MLGLTQVTARGGVPSIRIAVYKVCWSGGCKEASILVAFDNATKDLVHILSVSISESVSKKNIYFKDVLSVGSFHAMKHGVLTVFSFGNAGPYPKSLQNYQPWTIIVGSITWDMKFVTKVKTGNNITYETNSLDDKLVNGKIVLWEGDIGVAEAFRVGIVGGLMQEQAYIDIVVSFTLPTCYLQLKDVAEIHCFPTATIFKTIELKDSLTSVVASFSSRGPDNTTPEILKFRDLIAPTVDIMASWSQISDSNGETKKFMFNIILGTSMACPHVSGATTNIKSFHPTWSLVAIWSALITTVAPISSKNNQDAEFAYGAGQIDPVKVVNPGLI
ncbi:cucumisin-like [Vicia villosa]|uniref:cucumisin-like n=1 Tax=Vicia villosa TaxID=3911 RepID=UPI00273AC7DB|nr:cucumisin-like [Vicia villosa]